MTATLATATAHNFRDLLAFILPKPEEVKWQDRTEQQRRALTQE